MLLYLSIIYGYHPVENVLILTSPSATVIAILTLLGLIITRLGWGVSLIGFIYPVIVLNSIAELSSMGMVIGVIVLTALLILIDVISNVCFHFSSPSPASESLNINKIIHYIALCTGITLTYTFSGLAAHLPPFGMFLLLFFTKSASICKNSNHKSLLIRSYLFIICAHL